MASRTLVVGLGGSLAPRSHSLSALKLALEGAGGSGATTELLDLRELDLPMYRPDAAAVPPDVERMADRVHGSISGAFKNAIDWLQILSRREPPYLTDKVIGLIATAGGAQGLQAVNTMEFIVRALRGLAIPLVVPVPSAGQAFDADGAIKDPALEKQLRALGREVARVAGTFARGAALQKECERARGALAEIGAE